MLDDYAIRNNIYSFPELKVELIPDYNLNEVQCNLPFYYSKIQAGPPLSFDEYLSENYDLNELLLSHPTATCLLRAFKDYNLNSGIKKNDILIVDRSIPLSSNKIIVVATNNILTVRRFKIVKGQKLLFSSDESSSCVEMDHQYICWGIITYVIHKV